jgi:hypothetical protein
MSISENNRESEIMSLGLRPELVSLLLNKLDCGSFSKYFEKPEYFYSKGSPENSGYWPERGKRNLLPLWEHSEKVYALDTAKNTEGISFYIECPEEFDTFSSIDQAIFQMIELHVWEYGGSEKEIIEALDFAHKIALPNISGLKQLFSNYMVCTEEMITDYRRTL